MPSPLYSAGVECGPCCDSVAAICHAAVSLRIRRAGAVGQSYENSVSRDAESGKWRRGRRARVALHDELRRPRRPDGRHRRRPVRPRARLVRQRLAAPPPAPGPPARSPGPLNPLSAAEEVGRPPGRPAPGPGLADAESGRAASGSEWVAEQEDPAAEWQEDQGAREDQDGVHRQQAAEVHHLLEEKDGHHEKGSRSRIDGMIVPQPLTVALFPSGLRTVDADRNSGDVAGGERDGPRLHLRDAEAAADDHLGGGKGADPDVPQLAGSSQQHGGPADVGHGLRGDGADVHLARRGPESKADDVHGSYPAHAVASARFVSAGWVARRPQRHVGPRWLVTLGPPGPLARRPRRLVASGSPARTRSVVVVAVESLEPPRLFAVPVARLALARSLGRPRPPRPRSPRPRPARRPLRQRTARPVVAWLAIGPPERPVAGAHAAAAQSGQVVARSRLVSLSSLSLSPPFPLSLSLKSESKFIHSPSIQRVKENTLVWQPMSRKQI